MPDLLKDFYQAVRNDNLKEIISLLKKDPGLINQPASANSQTWLHKASRHNSLEIVKLLVEKGLDVNKADDDGDVPLHVAAHNKAYDVARWLLDNGAFIDGIDPEKSTPLVCAIISDDFEMVKLLRERGARLDLTFTKNKNNVKDIMSFALIYGNKKIIDYLKEDL